MDGRLEGVPFGTTRLTDPGSGLAKPLASTLQAHALACGSI